MKKFMLLVAGLCLVLSTFSWGSDQDKTDVSLRLESAAKTLTEIINTPDKGVPVEILEGAKCVAVVPRMIKGGFIFGAKHGRGVATCRLPNGHWSPPAFFAMTGGSWGAQIGAESVDLVMFIMNDEGMKHLLQNKFQIGGEASAAAGPVGRHASAGTDYKASTQILTYSRAHGAFAGVDLGGTWIAPDKDSTIAEYGRDIPVADILTGKVAAPANAHVFLAAVQRSVVEANAQKAKKAAEKQ